MRFPNRPAGPGEGDDRVAGQARREAARHPAEQSAIIVIGQQPNTALRAERQQHHARNQSCPSLALHVRPPLLWFDRTITRLGTIEPQRCTVSRRGGLPDMPRQVDHDRRRRQIAEAVWRLATRGGLETVTLRQVATEAGVLPRQLQYYFGTRDQVLLGALEILNTDAEQRARDRLSALGDPPGARALVRGVLLELLPLDEERRNRHLVYAAYFLRFLTEPTFIAAGRDAAPALENLVGGLLAQAQEDGQIPRDVDTGTEAAFLTAGADGLQASVLLGQRSPEQAVAVIDRQLDRIFAAPSPESGDRGESR
ncbi:TetR/AcrR family transcriptional regulator [Amycolatopsis vancoresmycina]|uniref:TetR/AcrR family transcriptional regulator n=2 Tax=Amycolatopsis vancoresmycina TaxID=208444 RepID=UPI00196A1898|nr:TetR/AcrR family transcriptional regulator [Amycolatopsis vancoresmycina]